MVFSESLRKRSPSAMSGSRWSNPGATATELASHNRPEVLDAMRGQFGAWGRRTADIADAITYIVTRPRHVAINEILIRPTEQER